jgi:hypothetical protein
MSLDLFANFERTSNSSLFYRITSSSPRTFVVKLSDADYFDENLNSLYYAEISVNGAPYNQFVADVNGRFVTNLTFNTASPCVCSINVSVSSGGTFYDSYSLSGIFVDRFPAVDFIAYPSSYANLNTGEVEFFDNTNYQSSPGVKFYGEGHTETILLSALPPKAGETLMWFIGNSLSSISVNQSNIQINSTSNSTANVQITSVLFDNRVYPISLRSTNTSITTAGPILTYNDIDGDLEFYPFFTSTLNVTGGELNLQTKGSITVMEYPVPITSTFDAPFASSLINLPLDYKVQTFRGILTTSIRDGFFPQIFIGTRWELQGSSEFGEWSVQTPFLESTLAYQFQLGYDSTANQLILPTFKASPTSPSTATLAVSSYKDVYIDAAPHDWQVKRVYDTHVSSTTISPIPIAKLYLPNYFNEKHQSVNIAVVDTPAPPLEFQTVTIKSSQSSETLVISGTSVTSLTGTMRFDRLGTANLSATALLRNTITNDLTETTVLLPEMLEVVNTYDEVEEKYFQSALTPLELTYISQPRLTPNEWAIADNINSIVEKFYTTIDELDGYTKLYEKKDKFYSWIGPIQDQSVYTWLDLECYDGAENVITWADFECGISGYTETWQFHECESSKSDPTCLQKYCLEWKWKSRKQGIADTNVTWKSAKCTGEFAKRWLYEKCATDSDSNHCDRDVWKVTTIDKNAFNIPSPTSITRCNIVDAEISSQSNQLVIAYPTEINLIDKDYFATYLARRGVADELFAFQNIVGLTINTEGKVIVLDSVLPRVSVYKITDNNFTLFSTWGSYGIASKPQGLNKPQDIHVDSDNSVWIADTGNNCIKKFTLIGRHLTTITHEKLDSYAPLSVCVDSVSNIHCLTSSRVLVFDKTGNYLFEYLLAEDILEAKKINCSYNKEFIYITYLNGVVKYFRTGVICNYVIKDHKCQDNQTLQGYGSLSQDKYRNVYVTVKDKIIKIADLQNINETKASLPANLYWPLSSLLVHKEEYIQPWVYLKTFHRLWDNIELLRNSLFYELEGCKSYTKPTYTKTDLIIGQNEIVSNAVINRISEQLWTNLQSIINYFSSTC